MRCKTCLKQLAKSQKVYCSTACQSEYQYQIYITEWRAGLRNGARGVHTQNFSRHVVRYLLDKYDHKCSQCGWDKINPLTKLCPLEIDHIDGDSNNNSESNLRILCPNCHSLTPSYKNLNKGAGRAWRREKYVKIVSTPL